MIPQNDQDARAALDGPAWRWNRIRSAKSSRAVVKDADQLVRDGVEYFRLCQHGANGSRKAIQLYPGFDAALRIQETEEATTALKILAVANCERKEMFQRTKLSEASIETWEQLFFDVRERLRSTGWIAAHIIEPLVQDGNGWLASRMKLALAGGPAAAAAILDADSTTALGEADRLFQRELKLQLKFDAALSVPVQNERQALAYVKLFADLKLRERQLELARDRLSARCQADLHRHKASLRRLELARERGQRLLDVRRWKRALVIAKRQWKARREAERLLNMTPVRADEACPALSRLKWKSSVESQGSRSEDAAQQRSLLAFSATKDAAEMIEASSVESPLEGTAA